MTALGVPARPPFLRSLPTKRVNAGGLNEANVMVPRVSVYATRHTEDLRASLHAQLGRHFV